VLRVLAIADLARVGREESEWPAGVTLVFGEVQACVASDVPGRVTRRVQALLTALMLGAARSKLAAPVSAHAVALCGEQPGAAHRRGGVDERAQRRGVGAAQRPGGGVGAVARRRPPRRADG
jgi:hypothetical protein